MIKTLELCGYWTDVFGRHKLAKVAGAVSSCFAAFREKPARLGVQMTKACGVMMQRLEKRWNWHYVMTCFFHSDCKRYERIRHERASSASWDEVDRVL